MNTARWTRLTAAALLLPLCATGCSATVRDALWAGAFDFVAGTVTELLFRLLPIADVVVPA
jgi:hypothetical protein